MKDNKDKFEIVEIKCYLDGRKVTVVQSNERQVADCLGYIFIGDEYKGVQSVKNAKPIDPIFWIFSHYINGVPVYERSTYYEYRAKERVDELKKRYGYEYAFYSTELPKHFY